MTAMTQLREVLGRKQAQGEDVPAAVAVVPETNDDKELGNASEDLKAMQEQQPSDEVQHGVKLAQALTLTWNKNSLVAIFIFMWFLYLTNGFQSSVLYSLTPYAASDFESHSLLPVIDIVSSAMTASVYIPLAKILDLWGRAEGFLLMVLFATLGMILLAASQNLATYCAATVFWQVGWSGLTYSIDVITADSTRLKNRGLAFAFTSSPYMITAFAGPKAAEGFLNHVSWRWGFGCFSIVLPIVAVPMYGILKWNIRKAKKKGTLIRGSSGRSFVENVRWGLVEFDVLGVVLFACGLVTFLLPFSLASTAPNGWKSAYVIAMIITGFVVLALFLLNELFLAPKPFFKFEFFADRTVMGACLLDITYQVAYYCWNSYFTSFLQVVNGLSVSNAGYVSNTFDVVSGVLLFVVGFSISKTGRFRWLLLVGVPLYTFGQGLMIYFRQPGQNIGYLVMCQIFTSIGGSVFILCMQVAILAAVDHQHVAAALAVLSVCGNIGGSVGNTISATIWTNTFEKALERNLPEAALGSLADIYSDLDTQLGYPVGSAERLAIQQAYGYAQMRMLAAGTSVMVFGFIAVFMIRNFDLKKMSQTKGLVF
ncbi:MFS siderochrome iron transporter MirB [Colletotrichum higginsianum]|uniref:MFS siderochrome iron transporter MirB n=2 Tax=Colletotrichum higginsianum TaxID=80884 RepID=H1V3I4_COLHI|nr:MFS siderochrome iron transporter MirB [Colletotrichum higginsianum IMI 349063]OBR10370.1 MFS siderochrome iron transporter MirB [Colletotrichum higginsianum IMI 349063]TID07774.1 Siderophore iron transporter mirB [Colletotrichum higginsianum]CCF34786.1 MFS siderochrome iron transporter MirB [Colletotrichum higginsianum]